MWFAFMRSWRNRKQSSEFRRWLTIWHKRVYYHAATGRLILRPFLVRWRGSNIGHLTILGKSRIQGDWSGLAIGYETSLGRCEFALHYKVTIRRRVVINDGVVVLPALHSLGVPPWRHKKAQITIAGHAWISLNATVFIGFNYCRGGVVGAGAVVREDVPDYGVVIGNHAQLMRGGRTHELNYSPVMVNAPFEAWGGPMRIGTAGGDET